MVAGPANISNCLLFILPLLDSPSSLCDSQPMKPRFMPIKLLCKCCSPPCIRQRPSTPSTSRRILNPNTSCGPLASCQRACRPGTRNDGLAGHLRSMRPHSWLLIRLRPATYSMQALGHQLVGLYVFARHTESAHNDGALPAAIG